MKPIVPPISSATNGPSVANLQDALLLLINKGIIQLPDDQRTRMNQYLPIEQHQQAYQDYTTSAVSFFQQQHQLTIGDVDAPTAAAINKFLQGLGALDPESGDQQRIVTGHVTDTNTNAPFAGGVVRAFDRDLRSEELLGEQVTDAQGVYSIGYSTDQFRRAEKASADLIVRVFNAAGTLLATSPTFFNAPAVQTIDLVISDPTGLPSEYERLVQMLEPLLVDVTIDGIPEPTLIDKLADLKAEDIDFLTGEMEVERQKLTFLVATANLEIIARAGQVNRPVLTPPAPLFYGLAREGLPTNLAALSTRTRQEQRAALEQALQDNLIPAQLQANLDERLDVLQQLLIRHSLKNPPTPDGHALGELLTLVLPAEPQQSGLLKLYLNNDGPIESFWDQVRAHPDFQTPGLVDKLQATLQLGLLTQNHVPLIQALQSEHQITTPRDLVTLQLHDWHVLVDRLGAPESIPGDDQPEKRANYVAGMISLVQAAYPTAVVAQLVSESAQIDLDISTRQGVTQFFANLPDLELGTTHIDSYVAAHADQAFQAIPAAAQSAVVATAKQLQRVFRVSTSPESMTALLDSPYTSAYAIANTPRAVFVNEMKEALGDEQTAHAIYAKAHFIYATTLHLYTRLYQARFDVTPRVLGTGFAQRSQLAATANPKGPAPLAQNEAIKISSTWDQMFGRLDLCDCADCRSVLSPAAYFVDLLHLLDPTVKNRGKTVNPFDVLLRRRPDLQYIPLTCENTNTPIPYIDLVNEILESYVVYGQLDNADHSVAKDTGDSTADELSASPQYTNEDAYKELRLADHPLTLPYSQSIEVARVYLEHLGSSRDQVMQLLHKEEMPATLRAIDAEYLRIAPEEYQMLTGFDFDDKLTRGSFGPVVKILQTKLQSTDAKLKFDTLGSFDDTTVAAVKTFQTAHALNPADGEVNAVTWAALLAAAPDLPDKFENLSQVPTFLHKTGIDYPDLVELVKTRFINPNQYVLALIERVKISQADLAKLIQTDFAVISEDVQTALDNANVTSKQLKGWVKIAQELIVLFAPPDTPCDLDQTVLQYLDGTALPDTIWPQFFKFIRLWRKLGWSITELDQVITVAKTTDITPDLLQTLAQVARVQAALRIPLVQVASLWTALETHGEHSLYSKLFLSRAAQRLDDSFKLNDDGSELANADPKPPITAHIPTILAAYRISEADLDLIRTDAKLENGQLTLANLSAMYRYVVLAKALKLKIKDLIALKTLSGTDPFATPTQTLQFIELVHKLKPAGFTVAQLNYLYRHLTDLPTSLAPQRASLLLLAKTLHDGLLKITADNASVDDPDGEVTRQKLGLLFESTVVDQTIRLINGSTVYATKLADLSRQPTLTFPASLASKIFYNDRVKLLTFSGFMSLTEKTQLLSLYSDQIYQKAIEQLFETARTNNTITVPLANLPVLTFPDSLKDKITYDNQAKILSFIGIILSDEKTQLLGLSSDQAYQQAIEQLAQWATSVHPARVLLSKLPALSFPDSLKNKISFDDKGQVLRFMGPMTTNEQTTLKGWSADENFTSAVDALYQQPRKFMTDTLSGIPDLGDAQAELLEKSSLDQAGIPVLLDPYRRLIALDKSGQPFLLDGDGNLLVDANGKPVVATLLDKDGKPVLDANGRPVVVTPVTTLIAAKFAYFLGKLLPYLCTKLSHGLAKQTMSDALKLENTTAELLLETVLQAVPYTTGLTAAYFTAKNFTGPTTTQIVPTIAFDGKDATPETTIPTQVASARWTGRLLAPTTDAYTFHLHTDGTLQLWLDNQSIADQEKITLQAGYLYNVRVECVTGPAAIAEIRWQIATQSPELIPAGHLYLIQPAVTDLVALSTNGLTAIYTRADGSPSNPIVVPMVGFDPSETPRPANLTRAYWTGMLLAPTNDTYTFYLEPASAMRLWIAGQPLADQESMTLKAGQLYDLSVEYESGDAGANVELRWQNATLPNSMIPSANFYPSNIFDAFTATFTRLQKAALLVNGFKLTTDELDYFNTHRADFANFDLQALPIDHTNPTLVDQNAVSLFQQWQRLAAYVTLRNNLPQRELELVDLFGFAAAGALKNQLSRTILQHLAALLTQNPSFINLLADWLPAPNWTPNTLSEEQIKAAIKLLLTISWSDISDSDLQSLLAASAPPLLITVPNPQQPSVTLPTGLSNLLDLVARLDESHILKLLLIAVTGWDSKDIASLTGTTGFNLAAEKYKDEVALTRLQTCIQLIRRAGISAEMLLKWATESTTFVQAQEIKNTVKAKYDDETWFTVAKPLSDTLRERQKAALIAYVLTMPDIIAEDITTSNQLFEYFLIDVDMSACMATSRIKQAISSVQTFIQRCFMNLEAEVSPTDIPADEWAWMKQYRIWEANRKVFLYPENWIEPELRDDKTPFFKELESGLLQNDLTTDTAETAFLSYLEKLDEIARLDICGMYWEQAPESTSGADDAINQLHVFGRTFHTRHVYYYRRLENNTNWTHWEKVPLDIEGDHLIPVVWNGRLYLFWPIFTEKSLEAQPTIITAQDKYLEIRLAWSELKNNKWSAKKLSSEGQSLNSIPRLNWKFIAPSEDEDTMDKSLYVFKAVSLKSQTADTDLEIQCIHRAMGVDSSGYLLNLPGTARGTFRFTSCNSVEHIQPFTFSQELLLEPERSVENFMTFKEAGDPKTNNLTLVTGYSGNDPNASWSQLSEFKIIVPTLKQTPSTYRVLYPLQYQQFFLQTPFFYQDNNRTYFVTPRIDNSIVDQMIHKELTVPKPYLGAFTPRSNLLGNGNHSSLSNQHALNAMANYATMDSLLPSRTQGVTKMMQPFALSTSRQWTATNALRATSIHALGPELPYYNLKFTTYFHPFVCSFIKALNRKGGIADLLTLANQKQNDLSNLNFMQYIPTDRVDIPYPLETVEFNQGVPYAVYNWELFFHSVTLIATRLSQNQRFEEAQHWFHYIFDPTASAFGPKGLEAQYFNNPNLDDPPAALRVDAQIDFSWGTRSPIADIIGTDNFSVRWTGYLLPQYNETYTFTTRTDQGVRLWIDNELQIDDWQDNGPIEHSIQKALKIGVAYTIKVECYKRDGRAVAQLFWESPSTPKAIIPQTQLSAWAPYWKVLPFLATEQERIDELLAALSYAGDDQSKKAHKEALEAQVEDWRHHPFQPHRIARLRLIAYQKHVVMKYIDNLIAWGDQLFRRETIEATNEATQLYILAANILGERPQRVPRRGTIQTETYASLRGKLDDFSNTFVTLENEFPYSGGLATSPATGDNESSGLLGIGHVLYFCTPQNDKLLGYWDLVADRLFKIRHCMDIEGVVRQLPLFEPPIDPTLLVRATAAGIDLNSVLNDINAPRPHYRFNVMLQKANELCAEVKALGGAFLAAQEKQDAEALALLRSGHELDLLNAVRQIKGQQIAEAEATLEGLNKYKDIVSARQQYYSSRPTRIPEEITHLNRINDSLNFQLSQQEFEATAATLHLIPDLKLGVPTTIGSTYGGSNVAPAVQAFASSLGIESSKVSNQGALSATLGGYVRRQHDWDHQADLAAKELKQVEQQITVASIRVEIANQELQNHDTQIANAQAVDEFMRNKFSNQELYSWMVAQLSSLYFQSYQLTYDIAKRAEKAYRFELGLSDSNFIQFGYWDSLKKGLLAGEKLAHDLKRLELAYLDKNKREYEITKHVSLLLHDPLALIRLKETGRCEIELPEALFDADYPGHYMRRLKSVSLTIPCVAGPYTNINCTLTLLKNETRIASIVGDAYEQNLDDDDERFVTNFAPLQSIATSHAQNDSGLFELNFRDERYLPFEGAGAISRWRIDLPQKNNAFDFETLSDIVLHLKYTARAGGEILAKAATAAREQIISDADQSELARLFSVRHEFSSQWHRFLHLAATDADTQTLQLDLSQERFPFQLRRTKLTINQVQLFLKLADDNTNGDLLFTLGKKELGQPDSPIQVLEEQPFKSEGSPIGNLAFCKFENCSIEVPQSLVLKVAKAALANLQNTIEDIWIVCQYSLSEG